MKLKTYQAWTMAEALAFVKKDLGADAVILHTRTYDRGGFFGFGRKTVVEITAARAADMPEPAAASSRASVLSSTASSTAISSATGRVQTRATGPAGDSVRQSAAARAYGAGARSIGVSSETTASGASALHSPAAMTAPVTRELDMEAEREKTRRLAAALAIQLEKQASERVAASRNEAATRERQAQEMAAPPGASRVGASVPHASTSTAAGASPAASSTAQRFVLVPEAAARGGGGLVAIAAATVRHDADAKVAPVAGREQADARAALLGPDRVKAVFVHEPRPAQDAPRTSEATPMATQSVPPTAAPITIEPKAEPTVEPTVEPARIDRTPAEVVGRAATSSPSVAESRAGAAAQGAPAELDAISAFVGKVLERGSTGAPHDVEGARSPRASERSAAAPSAKSPELSPALETTYARLIEQEVAEHLARRVLAEVERELQAARDAGAEPSAASVREAVERRLAALLPADDLDAYRILPGRHGARRIAFVGPTGVGKTTTLAKVAAQLRLKRNLRVGIVAADTYRIAAVDQLRTYAEILGLPIEVAASPADAARACERLGEVDVILIDTAGRSQNDRMKLSELRAFLASAAPDETHLVLSATAGARTLAREAEAFGALGIDRVALTKLDEAASFGTLVSLVEKLGTRVSFLTHGQEVPDHIELGRSRRLAALVMGSEVR